MRTIPAVWVISFCITACGLINHRLPETLGEQASGFGYVPLDGLPVLASSAPDACVTDGSHRPLLEALPDLSVRFAVASVSANGALSFGPAKVTTAGGTYRAVLDYVNVDEIPVGFFLRRIVRDRSIHGLLAADERYDALYSALGKNDEVLAFEAIRVSGNVSDSLAEQMRANGFAHVTIPVYIGIGLRLSADIRALKGGISLTSLSAIAAETQTNGVTGTLTLQTIGITGKAVATAIPLPSKLDQSTVENSILALGSSRSVLYGGDTIGVRTAPRVVGLYSPSGSDPRLINAIYSSLASDPLSWTSSCYPPIRHAVRGIN